MVRGFGKIGRKIGKIAKSSENEPGYGTGLVGEKLIISAYKDMSLDKLEKLRFILNKIIKKKKEMRRVADAKEGEGGD